MDGSRLRGHDEEIVRREKQPMVAYAIFDADIHDTSLMDEYLEKVPATL